MSESSPVAQSSRSGGRQRPRRRRNRGNTWKHPPEAKNFIGKDDKYGEYLIKKGIAMGSLKQAQAHKYEKYLWDRGKEVREEAKTYSTIIASTRLLEPEQVFAVEQQIKTSRTASAWKTTRRNTHRKRSVGAMTAPLGMDPLLLEKEAELGLGAHKSISVMKKSTHAPLPWGVINENGERTRTYSPGQFTDEQHGVFKKLDMYQDLVLFNSSKGQGLKSIVADLQPFYIPRAQRNALQEPMEFLSRATLGEIKESTRGMGKEKYAHCWKVIQTQNTPLGDYFPAAVESKLQLWLSLNLFGEEQAVQRKVIQKLIRVKKSKEGSSFSSLVIMDSFRWTVGTFYAFIKSQIGYSVHLVERDARKNVAVVTFGVTYRYYIAIFLDVDPARVVRSYLRLGKDLVNYGNAALGRSLEKQMKVLRAFENQVEILIESDKQVSSGASVTSELRTMLGAEEYSKETKRTTKGRKLEILNLPTTGIIEICLFPCSCTGTV